MSKSCELLSCVCPACGHWGPVCLAVSLWEGMDPQDIYGEVSCRLQCSAAQMFGYCPRDHQHKATVEDLEH